MWNTPEQKQTIVEQVKSTTTAEWLKKTLEQKWAKTELRNKMQEWLKTLDEAIKNKINENTIWAIKSMYDGNSKKEYPAKWTPDYQITQALASLYYCLNSGDKKYSFKPGKLAEEQAKNYINEVVLKETAEKPINDNTKKVEAWVSNTSNVSPNIEEPPIEEPPMMEVEKLEKENEKKQREFDTRVVAVWMTQDFSNKPLTWLSEQEVIARKVEALRSKIWSIVWPDDILKPNEVETIAKANEFLNLPYQNLLPLVKVIKNGKELKINEVFDKKNNVDTNLVFTFNGYKLKDRAKNDLIAVIQWKKITEEIAKNKLAYDIKDLSALNVTTTDSNWYTVVTKPNIPDKYKVSILEKGKLVDKIIVPINLAKWDSITGISSKLISPLSLS